jgi:type I restriction enzyme S subunit
MDDWPVVRLGDHVDLQVGFAFKSAEFTENPDDVRLVRGANVGQGQLKWDQERRYPAARYREFERYHLTSGDVVLAMDRPWVEAGLKWAVVREHDLPALLVQRVARLRGTATLEHEFIRYVLGSPGFEAYVRPIVTGVNVPHISGTQIEDFRFRLPPPEIQGRSLEVCPEWTT